MRFRGRASAVIASTAAATPTVLTTWQGPGLGVLLSLYVGSLAVGASDVTCYVLPAGVTAGADAHVLGPKQAACPDKGVWPFKLDGGLVLLEAGDTIALISSVAGGVKATASVQPWSGAT